MDLRAAGRSRRRGGGDHRSSAIGRRTSRRALRHMRDEGLDLIVTSGGLGPTADDLTAEVVGRFAGRDLKLDEEMEQKIADIIARYARRLRFDPEAVREANRKQAMVPEGAVAIDPAGTAPGLVVPADGQVVDVLPGPPRELQEMWPRALAAAPAQEVLGRAGAVRDDVDPDVRDPGVGARHGAAGDRGRGGAARRARGDDLPARGRAASPMSASREAAPPPPSSFGPGLESASAASPTPKPVSRSRRSCSGCSAIGPSRSPNRRAAGCSLRA